jgi:hypothetical protein
LGNLSDFCLASGRSGRIRLVCLGAWPLVVSRHILNEWFGSDPPGVPEGLWYVRNDRNRNALHVAKARISGETNMIARISYGSRGW